MKNFTLKSLVLAFTLCFSLSHSQEKNNVSQKLFNQDLTPANVKSIQETGLIRCGSTEYETYLQEKYPNRTSTEEFENWLAPKIQEFNSQRVAGPNVLQTIPVIFHIITDGFGSENLSQASIQAQINQLNIDYRNLAGSTYGAAADAEVEFCLAQQDENGAQLAEIGINRITAYGDSNFLNTYVDSTIKPATQWDPTKYMNVWVVGALTTGSFDLLGYAQFPDSSGLSDLPSNGGAANTDGIVVIAGSVGSIASPNPNGAQYASGRTLTHEAGHWLGLRHIWGDTTTCTNADYCADTPDASDANYSCPTVDSCPADGLGNDMVENYMDYTDDTCMHTLTANQATRVLTVLANSPRRVELVTSTVCQAAQILDLDGSINIDNLNFVDACTNSSITPDIVVTNLGNNQLTSSTINYYVDSNTPATYNWSGALNYNESETISLPLINVGLGSHSFNVELNNPNGGTDEDLSNNTSTENFSAGACPSVGDTTYATSTTGVEFNTISNLNTAKPSGYSDYTSISTDVNADQSYDLTVYMNTDGAYTCYTTVWIDWNQNCSFDDAGELYDLGSAVGVTNGASSNSPLSITVPTGATIGSTIMRVTTKYGSAATSCENGHDAEVEDYSINVMPALGVDDYFLNSLSIYPNPATDKLTIKLSNNDLPDGYKIYNMLGQTISESSISNLSDLEINTSALSNGMYFVKVSKDNSIVTLPFIKN